MAFISFFGIDGWVRSERITVINLKNEIWNWDENIEQSQRKKLKYQESATSHRSFVQWRDKNKGFSYAKKMVNE